jgi:hypothetical protein
MFIISILFLSITISNTSLRAQVAAFGDKDNQKLNGRSLNYNTSDQPLNIDTNSEALQNVIQQIQIQIAQIGGQDKATKTTNLINSIINLNPNGPLAHSLLYLANQDAIGNIGAVTKAAAQLASQRATGNIEDVEQVIRQAAGFQTEQSVFSSQASASPVSGSSTLGSSREVAALATSCGSLQVNSISAKGSDGHLPRNAIDGNLGTRWSNYGPGSWIKPDLGQLETICSVDIAWYRGNMRQNNFVISVSQDGNTFTDVFSGKSSGTTLSYERYSFPQIDGRYVKITVNGNTENNWASISEIKVNGFKRDRAPVANAGPDQIVNSGSVVTLDGSASNDPDGDPITLAWLQTSGPSVTLNNPNTSKPTFTAPSDIMSDSVIIFKLTVSDGRGLSSSDSTQITVKPSTLVDKFGIKEIYPTKSSGEEWFMNMLNPISDTRLFTRIDSSSFTKNADGSWKITNPPLESRFHIFTSSGYHQDQISTYNEATLASKGYMQSPNDWKNVEMTGYVKLNAYSDVDHAFVWYNRGGMHSTSFKCEGTAYKGNLNYVGQSRFQKEQWHPSYFTTSWIQATSSDPKNRWIGIKYVVYNFQLNGKTAVKMENWLDDKADGNWVKVYEHVDTGGWGTTGTDCGGSPDQLITWGGPDATFRFDAITNLDFKNFSVREIQPPQ